MATFTTEMALEKPASGAENFDESMNDNADLIDQGGTYYALASEDIDKGEWVGFDASDEAELAQADVVANSMVVGICIEDVLNGADGYFRYAGVLNVAGWGLTPSSQYYLDPDNPGKMVTLRPSGAEVVVELGQSDSTGTKFYIRIRIYTTVVTGGRHSTLVERDWSVAGHIMDATLDMNSNAIGEVASITMDEDAWIGIGVASERIVFDGTGGQIQIEGANLDLNTNDLIAG